MNRTEIQRVTISPNPVNAKAPVKVSVQAANKIINFQKVTEYAKEIYANQQIGVI